MDRKQFLKACGFGCLAAISGTTILNGCSSSQISREIKESDLLVPISDFIVQKGAKTQFKKYIVIQNDILKAPICVFRFSENDYSAIFMLCTHQEQNYRCLEINFNVLLMEVNSTAAETLKAALQVQP